jgi:hypothetical protein
MMAYPVVYAAGTTLGDGTIAGSGRIMNNITHISCGDVFGMALDVYGYVWTWGSGWNNATGNTTSNYSGSDPRRVLKGITTGRSNDGTFLLAKQIGGGQGYGMAVTADNKPVAWGGGGCANGGATGNGTLTGSTNGTGYIMRSAGVVDNNVIAINRGDLWGSYQTSDNKIYTWGCNSGPYAGVLGIGNSIDQPYATQLVPPAACGFKDPVPTAKLLPRDTTVCQSGFVGLYLNSGFVIDNTIASYYTIKWFKNNGTTPVQIGTAATSTTYKVVTAGKYSVEVSYAGANAGCIPYDVAKDSMTIAVFPQTFTAPTNLTYCNLKPVKVNVFSSSTTNAGYSFYPTATSTISLGSSVGSASTTIDLTTATAIGTDRIVYAEEKAYATGSVMKKAQGCDTTWMTVSDYLNPGAVTDNSQSGFIISEPLNLDSLNIMLQSAIYTIGSSYAGTIIFNIYGNKRGSNGGLVADPANKIGTFTYAFNRTRTAAEPQTVTQVARVPVGIKLTSTGTYFISMDNFGQVTGSGMLSVGRGICAQSIPVMDDISGAGTIITYSYSSSAFTNPQTGTNLTQGRFFNVTFKTLQHFCDRIPITIKQCVPTGIGASANSSFEFTVFPNPINNVLQVQYKLDATTKVQCELYDLKGTKLKTLFSEEQSSEVKKEINVEPLNLSDGLYLLQLSIGNRSFHKLVSVVK